MTAHVMRGKPAVEVIDELKSCSAALRTQNAVCNNRMPAMRLITEWFKTNLFRSQIVFLTLVLALGFAVVLTMGDMLARCWPVP